MRDRPEAFVYLAQSRTTLGTCVQLPAEKPPDVVAHIEIGMPTLFHLTYDSGRNHCVQHKRRLVCIAVTQLPTHVGIA